MGWPDSEFPFLSGGGVGGVLKGAVELTLNPTPIMENRRSPAEEYLAAHTTPSFGMFQSVVMAISGLCEMALFLLWGYDRHG